VPHKSEKKEKNWGKKTKKSIKEKKGGFLPQPQIAKVQKIGGGKGAEKNNKGLKRGRKKRKVCVNKNRRSAEQISANGRRHKRFEAAGCEKLGCQRTPDEKKSGSMGGEEE